MLKYLNKESSKYNFKLRPHPHEGSFFGLNQPVKNTLNHQLTTLGLIILKHERYQIDVGACWSDKTLNANSQYFQLHLYRYLIHIS